MALGPQQSLDLDTALRELPGIGPARSRALGRAGYRTVGELLLHLPFRYEDRSRRRRVDELTEEGPVYLRGRLRDLRRVRVRRRGLTLVRGRLEDESGSLPLLWFNRPYLIDQVDESREYALYGSLRPRGGGWELVNPSCEAVEERLHCGRIVPVYPAVGKLGPTGLRRLMNGILDRLDLEALEDRIPAALRSRYRLPAFGRALADLHRPSADQDVDRLNRRQTGAHRRLIYGELLELQLELAMVRARQTREPKAHRYRVDDETRRLAREALPFRLTGAQRRVLGEIVADLVSPYPMLRLLQGDVGSGKTIVAALALLVTMESGLQGAFMAPTELLAEQHYRNLSRLLGERYRLALLTGSAEAAASARRLLARGEVQLAVGTHALIQEGVEFRRLGLAVIDEQHRFGVSQREILQRKGARPDMLVMTATPIPRSLALTVYGDLALSALDEMPPGRSPVVTRVVPAAQRSRVYDWLARELAKGARAYVVFPLIEESDRVEADSLERLGGKIRERLGASCSGVLHGRLAAEERDEVMRRFAAGDLQVLLATTVIEVGVDIPEATIMIIESAERFGLAQIHQLRGRVGRGRRRSYCVAIHNRLGEEARRRLEVFADCSDGFRLAEVDLEIRGPGDLLGTRQSGLPLFRVANLVTDRKWLERAREDAFRLLRESPEERPEALLEEVSRRAAARAARLAGG